MGENDVNAFVAKYTGDESFRDRVNQAIDDLLRLAEGQGLTISRSDLANALKKVYEDDPYFLSERPSFD